jgi:hypothetical protein
MSSINSVNSDVNVTNPNLEDSAPSAQTEDRVFAELAQANQPLSNHPTADMDGVESEVMGGLRPANGGWMS